MARRLASFDMPRPGASAHFWLYSLMAAPFVGLAESTGVGALPGFTVVNVLLLSGAAWVLAGRLNWASCALVVVSPVMWWLDKPHTEVLNVACVAIGLALLDQRPNAALPAMAIAACQNPSFVGLPLAGVVTSWALRRRWSDKSRVWLGTSIAAAIVVLHPLYYLVRLGSLSGLSRAAHLHVPTVGELIVPLADPTLGLLPAAPFFALAVVSAVAVGWSRTWFRQPATWTAIVGVLTLMAAAAQATNVNHGGTPGLSRYATWFVPLSVPVLLAARAVRGRGRALVSLLAAASAAWSVVWFRPAVPEVYDRPTRLAAWLWHEHPTWHDPLPEIFAERLTALDENWLPVATAGCEKVLLTGRGGRDSAWPVPCAPVAIPPACDRPGSLCYANRTPRGYDFSVPSVATPQAFRLRREVTWPLAVQSTARRLLEDLRWWELRVVPVSEPGASVRAAANVDRAFLWQGDDRLLLFLSGVREDARVALRVAFDMRGAVIDGERGSEQPVRVGATSDGPHQLPIVGTGSTAFLVLRRAMP